MCREGWSEGCIRRFWPLCCCSATVLLLWRCFGDVVLWCCSVCFATVLLCCCSVHLANVLVWCKQGWHTGHWPVCGSGHSADSSVQLRQCAAVWSLAPVTSVLQHWSVGCLQFIPVCSWQCAECSVEVWGERAMCRPPQCGTLPNSLLLSAHC